MLAQPDRPLAANNHLLELLVGGEILDLDFLFLDGTLAEAGEVGHVDLERVAIAAVLKDEFAGQLDFLLRNLVKWIDFGVVDNGRIQAAIHGLLEEDGVEHAARISIQAE